jgi:valyl-tRNA synthetase
MMMGLHFQREVPFRDVYIHALVRDMEGQKMSKSRGNAIDPLDLMDQYGTDALRFTLAALAAQGRDIRLSTERIEGYRNFANKIWNAARFVLANTTDYRPGRTRRAEAGLADRWIRSRLARTVAEVRRGLASYRFNDAATAIYQFLWHEYCDWYLEWSKLALYRGDEPAARARTQATLLGVLETTLPDAEREMASLMGIVTAVRNVRSEMQIPPSRRVAVILRPPDAERAMRLEGSVGPLSALARAEVRVDPAAERPPQSALGLVDGCEVYVPLAGVIDLAAEHRRLSRELARVDGELARIEAKLGRPEFRERAPADVVLREEARRDAETAVRATLREALARLES